jgi:hypothetical protein
VSEPVQASLLAWSPPQAAPKAPDGVKRAAKAGTRVDAAVLRWARANVGVDRPKEALRAYVEAEVGKLEPDTSRRRLRELKNMGLVGVEKAGLGCIRIAWVRREDREGEP